MTDIHSIRTIAELTNGAHTEIRVIYIEYAGGGECYEFEIVERGDMVHRSDDGYGDTIAAAMAAGRWIDNNLGTTRASGGNAPMIGGGS